MTDMMPPPSGGRPGGMPASPSGAYEAGHAWEGKAESAARPDPAKPTGLSEIPGVAQVMDFATELLGAVRDSATALLDEQRTRAANELDAFGEGLRSSVQSVDEAVGDVVAGYTDDVARQINQFANRLRSHSWGEVAGDVKDFARRWPVPFMAAVIGAGFIGGRLLVASPGRSDEKTPVEPRTPAAPTTTQFCPTQSTPDPATGGAVPAGERPESVKFTAGAISGGES